ncbi:hypothetical protein F5J12DRAFT_779130 [Pisolithus orientalis]|uniref:uncharacterized protein n=1 Tax=Pisolithus orientalis TaxID=936130 RepID=UPI002224701D|nr:uncharacterized protein F5J12DRAFT_779130 [Pisolithus orientalis]KAI6032671.1 hypothetical protein F5J12DRAFT_779130 [Pisolithus orientalis]
MPPKKHSKNAQPMTESTGLKPGACSNCQKHKICCNMSSGAAACSACTKSGSECIPQESQTQTHSNTTPPMDAQGTSRASEGQGHEKPNSAAPQPTTMGPTDSQARCQCQLESIAQKNKASIAPTCNIPLLNPIPEPEDTYNPDTDFFQLDVPTTTEFINSITGYNSDIGMETYESGSVEEINMDISMDSTDDPDDGGNLTSGSEDLDRCIAQYLCQHSKPTVGHTPGKQQPGRPKGSSKMVVAEAVTTEELETHHMLLFSKFIV